VFGSDDIGHPRDTEPGGFFESRLDLARARVHRHTQAGITGTSNIGAESIVLNGGYEDDVDAGDVIIYTGYGGNDPKTKKQIGHQHLSGWNQALARSCADGLPVRVIRGHRGDRAWSPEVGYVYSGLYRVTEYWMEAGRSGFNVVRFRLEGVPGQTIYDPAPTRVFSEEVPRRVDQVIQRIVRNTDIAQQVKLLHDHRCQICDERLSTPSGPYAEAAHIQPLGDPHNGPDIIENVLCLCPNHHVQFDLGAFTISEDLRVIDSLTDEIIGELQMVPRHTIDAKYLAHHRMRFGHLT
jgi:putative restriction endonuclease